MKTISRFTVIMAAVSWFFLAATASRAGQIAWASSEGLTSDVYGIRLMNDDGTNARAIVAPSSGIANCLYPSINPTGDKIAFSGLSSADNTYDLFVVNTDGTGLRQLTSGLANDFVPSWSPDGTQIVFGRRPAGLGFVPGDIYIVNSDGNNLRLLANVDNDMFPDWSPNGQVIAFSSGSNISITSGNYLLTNVSGARFSWNRNSRTFLYSPVVGIFISRSYQTGEQVPNLGDFAVTRNTDPIFTDRDDFVFSSMRAIGTDLYKANMDGTNLQRLTFSGTADGIVKNINPSWGPNFQNRFPTLLDQTVATALNQSVNITLSGSDPDGDALNYSILSIASHIPNNPANGVLSGVAPNLIYMPNANFRGTDSFAFNVNDGAAVSRTATVSIQVATSTPAPTPTPTPTPSPTPSTPLVANNDAYSLILKGSRPNRMLVVAAPGVLSNDKITYKLKKIALVGKPSGGSVDLRSNGSFAFKALRSGIFTFSYRLTDQKGNNSNATVTISVTSG